MQFLDDVLAAYPLRLRAARLYLDSREERPIRNEELGRRVGERMKRSPIDKSAVARWGKICRGQMVLPDTRTSIALALVCSADTPGAVDPGWLLCGDASLAPPPPTWELVVRVVRERAQAPLYQPRDGRRGFDGERLSDHEIADLAALLHLDPATLGPPRFGGLSRREVRTDGRTNGRTDGRRKTPKKARR